MKLYRTAYEGYTASTNPTFTWQGTQADALAERKKLTAEGKQGVKTDDIDVPVDKPSLLAWLNQNCTGK